MNPTGSSRPCNRPNCHKETTSPIGVCHDCSTDILQEVTKDDATPKFTCESTPYNPGESRDFFDHYTKELARADARNLDQVIKETITAHLGEDWTLKSIIHRVSIIESDRSPEKTLIIDGKPALQFWPPTLEITQEGHATIATTKRNYQKL